MAKIDTEDVEAETQTDQDVPHIRVLGHTAEGIAIRLGWKSGMKTISNSRFKFLKEEMAMDVHDEPSDYLF